MSESSTESFNFVNSELNILEFWQKNQIFKKSLEKTKNNKPYIFYDGPPFATGLPHHGHLVASTLKDIVPRFFTMKGYHVDRRFGWDCHGLPIEQEIDKKHEMSAMDFVDKHGIKKYNEECRGIVQRFTAEWEKTISRLGRWVDFENDYKTMDLSFMESVWWVFNQAWEKGLIYEGHKVVPFSTALGTGLANFEATQNYQSVQDPAITALFKSKDEDNTFFLAWTTTPWTLPSNLGLCVHPELDYVKVKDQETNNFLYMGKDRVEYYKKKKKKLEIVEEFKGIDLKGKTYEPLFPYFKEFANDGAFKVFADDYVTATDGTGIVHIAPGHGEDDHRVFKEAGLISADKTVVACPIDNAGRYSEEVIDFKGLYVKDADKLVIKNLKERDQLFLQETCVHNYAFCYRTDTPLINKLIPQWYLAVDKIKDKMMKSNEQINWVPGHIKEGRFGKWLEGARDWAISRNRYWGTPLPIWRNETTGNFKCFGSIADLEKATGTKVNDLHRDTVDELTFSIDGEEGTYKRIADVLDCWFESGSMPYAQLHYPFENKEVFDNGFPAEFIAEGLDQTRGWFYTLTVLSSMLFDKPAFKNVIVNGMVLAADGKKMSKRLKNYTAPDILMEKFGADALRLYMINSGIVKGEELRFTDDGVKDMVRRALLPWYNSFKFFQTYSEVDGWSPEKNLKFGDNITDRWVLSKLQTLIKNVDKEMMGYRLYNVVPELFNFIEDLTNWYIRLNRRRFWAEGLTDDKCHAYSTLYTTIRTISSLMAPFAPYLSDFIYLELQKMGKVEDCQDLSVHLTDFPEVKNEWINSTLEDAVDRMQQVILLGRQKRNQINVKVKTPLARLTVLHKDQALLDEMAKLSEYIQVELNIKDIQFSTDEDNYISLYCKPNLPVLGPKLGKEMGKFRKILMELPSSDLAKLEAGEKLEIEGKSFTSEDVLVLREAKEGTQALSNRLISIDMDCELTDELVNEGLAREVVNRIQKTRKDLNFNVSDRILVRFNASERLEKAINEHGQYISRETLAEKIEKESSLSQGIDFKIDDYQLNLEIQRV